MTLLTNRGYRDKLQRVEVRVASDHHTKPSQYRGRRQKSIFSPKKKQRNWGLLKPTPEAFTEVLATIGEHLVSTDEASSSSPGQQQKQQTTTTGTCKYLLPPPSSRIRHNKVYSHSSSPYLHPRNNSNNRRSSSSSGTAVPLPPLHPHPHLASTTSSKLLQPHFCSTYSPSLPRHL